MTAAMRGEWTKLSTIRSPWATMALALVMLVGIGAARALTSDGPFGTGHLVQGAGTAMLLVLALGSVAATTEYVTGTYGLTVLADASRSRVFAAKALVVAMASAVAAAMGAAVLFLVGAAAPNTVIDWTAADVRAVWGLVPVWALCGVIGVAVGTLVRRTAPAVVLVVLWPLALEPLVGTIPQVGDDVVKWMPFRNAVQFYNPSALPDGAAHNPAVAVAVFAAYALVLAILAVVVDRRRSA